MKDLFFKAIVAGIMSVVLPFQATAQTDNEHEKISGMTHDLTITRVFDAPPEEVWKAWSESMIT